MSLWIFYFMLQIYYFFQSPFTLSVVLHEFQCAAQRWDSHIPYKVLPWYFQCLLAPHTVITTITDRIPCAALSTPTAILWLPICTFYSLHLLHPVPQTPSLLAAISLFSVSMSLFLSCLCLYIVVQIPNVNPVVFLCLWLTYFT